MLFYWDISAHKFTEKWNDTKLKIPINLIISWIIVHSFNFTIAWIRNYVDIDEFNMYRVSIAVLFGSRSSGILLPPGLSYLAV